MMDAVWNWLTHGRGERGQLRALVGVCLAVSLCVGCAGWRSKAKPTYDIPVQDSVVEQWKFAMQLHAKFNDPLYKDFRQENGNKTLAAYQKLVEAWPEATDYVNRSRLAMALVTDGMGQRSEALKQYESLRRELPNDDKVVVYCLYYAAQIYDSQKKYDKAQEYYREIVRDYKDKKAPDIKEFVARAEILRNQIHKR